jgi:hypothetical protein
MPALTKPVYSRMPAVIDNPCQAVSKLVNIPAGSVRIEHTGAGAYKQKFQPRWVIELSENHWIKSPRDMPKPTGRTLPLKPVHPRHVDTANLSKYSVSSPHKTLVIIELNIRRCGSIILIVRKDIEAVVLPHIQATKVVPRSILTVVFFVMAE